jgi:hypothetical protein
MNMKTSVALKKATDLNNKIDALLLDHSYRLRQILNDDSAHFCYQPGDGWCIAYRGGNDNAAVSLLDIDAVMELSGEEFLAAIDEAGI